MCGFTQHTTNHLLYVPTFFGLSVSGFRLNTKTVVLPTNPCFLPGEGVGCVRHLRRCKEKVAPYFVQNRILHFGYEEKNVCVTHWAVEETDATTLVDRGDTVCPRRCHSLLLLGVIVPVIYVTAHQSVVYTWHV